MSQTVQHAYNPLQYGKLFRRMNAHHSTIQRRQPYHPKLATDKHRNSAPSYLARYCLAHQRHVADAAEVCRGRLGLLLLRLRLLQSLGYGVDPCLLLLCSLPLWEEHSNTVYHLHLWLPCRCALLLLLYGGSAGRLGSRVPVITVHLTHLLQVGLCSKGETPTLLIAFPAPMQPTTPTSFVQPTTLLYCWRLGFGHSARN